MKKTKQNVMYSLLGFSLLVLLCGLSSWGDAAAATKTGIVSEEDFPIEIAGEVKNATGEPLLGVSVRVKGASRGTVTNSNGHFEITADTASVLVFSYIGYVNQEVPISDLEDPNNAIIILQTVNKGLNEVVIVGYGEKERQDLTSAVSTIDMEKVAPIPVQSINDAVAGRVPGLFVTRADGEPGTKSQLSIRGGAAPLFIIDGVVRSQADFENLNPNDIENYSVLKDAAATSVYGAQGGDGVILVTTKSGKAGEVRVNYSFNQIYSGPTFWSEKIDAYDQALVQNKVYAAENKPPLVNETRLGVLKESRHLDAEMMDILLKNFAPEQRHDLSLSMGNKLLTYFGSFSYYDQGTILHTDKSWNRRLTYRMNTKSNFEKIGLQVTMGLDGYFENFSTPRSTSAVNTMQIFEHIYYRIHTTSPFTPLGLLTQHAGPFLDLAEESGYIRRSPRSINGYADFNWQSPIKGLSFRAKVNYGVWDRYDKEWNRIAPFYVDSSRVPNTLKFPDLLERNQTSKSLTAQGYINYNKRFGDHSLSLSGIYEQWRYKGSTMSVRRRQYSIFYDEFFAGPAENQVATADESEAARAGYIGRASYGYKRKYGLDLTMRYDGNDLFPDGHRWGLFYAVSGRWTLTEEPFMASFKEKNILNYLKLRGSYGVTGTTGGIRRYQYVPGYTITANAYVVDGSPVMGISEGGLPSTDYSWYSIDSRNLGLDFETLDSRLIGSFDYFYKRTSGYVHPDTRYGAVLGQPLPYVNSDAGRRREGFDFNVAWKDKAGDFTYALGFNFGKFNQLWEINPNEDDTKQKDPYTRLSNTDDRFLILGNVTDGLYQHNSDLLEGPRRLASLNAAAGDIRYKDMNGDGQIDASDMRKIGSNTFPHVNFGWTMDFGYKGIYMSAVVMGSGLRDRYFGSSIRRNLLYNYQKNFWRPDNTDGPMFPRMVSNINANGANNDITSDWWILTSGYVRLKYLQLGYDVKYKLLKNSVFKTFKVFVSGTNLLTHSKGLKYFIDPEGNANNTSYPIQRTFSFGVNIGF